MISFASPAREHAALAESIEQAVLRVLRSGAYILGNEVSQFEQELSRFCRIPHAVGVSSGTDALVCALHALGIGPGDEVLVPAFGLVAAPEAIVRVGARPVFVDIEPFALGLDLKAAQLARTPRTKAVLVMHLFGQAVDIDAVRGALDGLFVIEDAAQAIGTQLRGRHVGTLGDVGILSFFPAKSLGTAGDGGAVITPLPEVAEAVRRARAHGTDTAYRWASLGGNYRLDAIQAAVLRVKLTVLPARLERRRALGLRLSSLLRELGAWPMAGIDGCMPTFAPLCARVRSRDEVHKVLRELGIDARIQYPATFPGSPAFKGLVASDARFPEAQRASCELVSIPCHPELTDEEISSLEASLREAIHG